MLFLLTFFRCWNNFVFFTRTFILSEGFTVRSKTKNLILIKSLASNLLIKSQFEEQFD